MKNLKLLLIALALSGCRSDDPAAIRDSVRRLHDTFNVRFQVLDISLQHTVACAGYDILITDGSHKSSYSEKHALNLQLRDGYWFPALPPVSLKSCQAAVEAESGRAPFYLRLVKPGSFGELPGAPDDLDQ
jgi:hypothetical protein